MFGSKTCVPVSGMCKKQTSVSHSSTESEMISLGAGLRMEGLPALELWDLVTEVFRATQEISKLTQACSGNPLAFQENPTKIGQVSNVELSNIDQVPSNAHHSERKSQLYIFEDNEAVIKMIIKARSPTTRNVSRTHGGALDWCSTESIWIRRFKLNTSNQIINSQTS